MLGVVPPLTEPPSFELAEDHSDEFPEGGGVRGLNILRLAVVNVKVVDDTAGQAHPIASLKILQQPLHLTQHHHYESELCLHLLLTLH